MALPALLEAQDLTRVSFQYADEVRPELRYSEPGTLATNADYELQDALFPSVTQVSTILLVDGDDSSTGDWLVEVTPIMTQNGPASADGMSTASFGHTAAATSLADLRTALIAAATATGTITTGAMLATWNRLLSYVTVEADAVAATIKLTSVAAGMTFRVTVTAPAGSSATVTDVLVPGTTTANVGFYQLIDRTKGTNGFSKKGIPYLRPITSVADSPADFVGPLFKGNGLDPMEPGDAYRTYGQGSDVSIPKWGEFHAYGEAALDSANATVWVRHTAAGDFPTGSVTNAAGAAVGATANLWTGTPTAVDSTRYAAQITVTKEDGTVVTEEISFTAGAGTTATLICNGLRTNLGLKASLSGLVTGSGTATLLLTGPADGRAVTVTSAGPGTLAFVETTEEVSTHHPHPRDTFQASSIGIGSVPVIVRAA
jgi:hypothetical protein